MTDADRIEELEENYKGCCGSIEMFIRIVEKKSMRIAHLESVLRRLAEPVQDIKNLAPFGELVARIGVAKEALK